MKRTYSFGLPLPEQLTMADLDLMRAKALLADPVHPAGEFRGIKFFTCEGFPRGEAVAINQHERLLIRLEAPARIPAEIEK